MKTNDYEVFRFGDNTYHIRERETMHVICTLTFQEDKEMKIDLFMNIVHQIIVNHQGENTDG